MKILVLLLALAMSAPAMAADASSSDSNPAKTEPAAPDKNDNAPKSDTQAKEEKPALPDDEFSCEYYTVKLPADWKAIVPPTDQQGTVNAIFAKNSGNPVITMIIGPNGGSDAKTIAQMFAEQFKAPKPPVEKNGQYQFSFPQHDGVATACVAVVDSKFMITTYTGNQKEIREFLKNSIKSEKYSDLLPK